MIWREKWLSRECRLATTKVKQEYQITQECKCKSMRERLENKRERECNSIKQTLASKILIRRSRAAHYLGR